MITLLIKIDEKPVFFYKIKKWVTNLTHNL